MVSCCSRKMQTIITIVMCKIWCNSDAGRCWHILHTLQILPPCVYCLLAHKKEHLWSKLFELEDYVNTVNASLHCLSKHDYIIYSRWEKCVWTLLVITVSTGHMCKHSGLRIMLSCFPLLQSNHTHVFFRPCLYFMCFANQCEHNCRCRLHYFQTTCITS